VRRLERWSPRQRLELSGMAAYGSSVLTTAMVWFSICGIAWVVSEPS